MSYPLIVRWRRALFIATLAALTGFGDAFAPVAEFKPTDTVAALSKIKGADATGYYRDIVVEESGGGKSVVYIGGRNNLYKLPLPFNHRTSIRAAEVKNVGLDTSRTPDFGPDQVLAPDWSTLSVTDRRVTEYEPFYSAIGYDPAAIDEFDRTSGGTPYYLYEDWGRTYSFQAREYLEGVVTDLLQAVNLDYKLKSPLGRGSLGTLLPMRGSGQIDTMEQYGGVNFNPEITYKTLCEEQVKVLKAYYGEYLLEMGLTDVAALCSRHFRAPALMKGSPGRLFSLHTGLFGTLPITASGINDYARGWLPKDMDLQTFYRFMAFEFRQRVYKPYYEAQYLIRKQNKTGQYPLDPMEYGFERRRHPDQTSNSSWFVPDEIGMLFGEHEQEQRIPFTINFAERMLSFSDHVPPSPANFLGKKIFCDYGPAPNRMIFDDNTFNVTHESVLPPPSERASCSRGNLAMSLLSGYHPDQASLSLAAEVDGREAVFIMAEMGQERQLDSNREFLNMPEILPFTSSASLVMARAYIDPSTGDLDPSSIVISNPFKYTWVTSPLNRFGRMQKTGSMDQVPHRPRAIALTEDDTHVYFFFAEAEWESAPFGEYKIGRYHHTLTSYQRALYFPWEEELVKDSERLIKETEPQSGHRPAEAKYNPRGDAWRRGVEGMRVTGRVARVCKSDQGLPLGVQDANLFDLDHHLSLNAFQTFVKAKVTCRIALPSTSNYWRHRADVRHLRKESPDGAKYPGTGRNGDGSDLLFGHDFTYRAPGGGGLDAASYYDWLDSDEPRHTARQFVDVNLFRKINYTGFVPYHYMTDYHAWKWSYKGRVKGTDAGAYVEYSELKDVHRVGDMFYGVFGRGGAEGHARRAAAGDKASSDDYASALCTFSLDQVKQAFAGPFKRRVNNAWRAANPVTDDGGGSQRPITPDPRGCDADPIKARAEAVESMRINLFDETVKEEEDAERFDMRGNSERLGFFEKDVEGSRTMWEDVKAEPIGNFPGVAMDKIAVDIVGERTVLFVTTAQGKIHKYLLSKEITEEPWESNKDDLLKLLNTSRLFDPLFDNRFYSYFNKTIVPELINPVDPSAGYRYRPVFESYLTMEQEVKFPDDYTIRSDWLKKRAQRGKRYRLLSVLAPFEADVKIWSFKLSRSTGELIVGIDDNVTIIPIEAQCSNYARCDACAGDPHCGWSVTGGRCEAYRETQHIQSLDGKSSACSGCKTTKEMKTDAGVTLILKGVTDPPSLGTPFDGNTADVLASYSWFWRKHDAKITDGYDKIMDDYVHYMTARQDNSLVLVRPTTDLAGTYELRDEMGTCVKRYSVSMSNCGFDDLECQYINQYRKWCTEYEIWYRNYEDWGKIYNGNTCPPLGLQQGPG